MSQSIPGWSFDPAAVTLGGKAADLLQVEFGAAMQARASLVAFGTWWVLPFGQRRDARVVGVRLLPGVAPGQCPVVEVDNFDVMTVAARPSVYVPAALFLLNRAPSRWGVVSGAPAEAWGELQDLHAALGGTDALKGARALFGDAALRKGVGASDTEPIIAAFKRTDPSPEAVRFWEYVEVACQSFEAPMPLPDVGNWRPAAASIAYQTNDFSYQGEPTAELLERLLAAAWEVVQQPAGLDTFMTQPPIAFWSPMHDVTSGTALVAPRALKEHQEHVPAAWKKDPMWQVVEAIAAKGERYDAQAHLEAAKALGAQGQFERAYWATVGAASWRRALKKDPIPGLAESAVLLAQEQGWDAIAEMIRANLAAAEEFMAGRKGGGGGGPAKAKADKAEGASKTASKSTKSKK